MCLLPCSVNLPHIQPGASHFGRVNTVICIHSSSVISSVFKRYDARALSYGNVKHKHWLSGFAAFGR